MFGRFHIPVAMILKALSLSLVLVAPTTSHANIMDFVDNGNFTLDTLSAREWLDLTQSTSISYNTVVGSDHNCNPVCTNSASQFFGLTFASSADVIELFSNAGIGPVGTSTPDLGSQLAMDTLAFINLFGPTASQGPPATLQREAVEGRTSTLLSATSHILYQVRHQTAPTTVARVSQFGLQNTAVGGTAGIFFYRPVSVPEPASLTLFGVGLGILGFMLRRRRNGLLSTP